MGIGKIKKLFETHSVCVCGMKGCGKDMLSANVAIRRRKPYVSNTYYGGGKASDGGMWFPFSYDALALGGNTYDDFIHGTVKKYVYPYPDGTDFYIADVGVYFPSQYCNELNRKYAQLPLFMALSRHVGQAAVHWNCQNLSRCWDKIREMSDCFLRCEWCRVIFGKIVIQKVTYYELYDPCLKRVPPFRLRKPLFNQNRLFQWRIQKANYLISHGIIKSYLLVYWNKADYNTRVFKEMLENGLGGN